VLRRLSFLRGRVWRTCGASSRSKRSTSADIDNLKQGEVVIIEDFMENLNLQGTGRTQTNKEFYSSLKRVVMGHTVLYRDNEGKLVKEFVGVVSEFIKKDGRFYQSCFEKLIDKLLRDGTIGPQTITLNVCFFLADCL
jgi:hypothetical protein